MKKLIVLLTSVVFVSLVSAQDKVILHLKNGSEVSGSVIEKTPNEQITIKSSNDSVTVYRFSEIASIVDDNVIPDEYGGTFSYGVAFGGGGIVGMPIRVYPSEKFAIEGGIFYKISNISNILVAGGPVLYFSKKYYPRKEKITMHGISLKGGKTFSNFSETFSSFSWVYERFKKKNKNYSFIFELGGGVFFVSSSSFVRYSSGDLAQPTIYLKLHWNWYN